MALRNRVFKLTVPSLPDVTEADWKEYIQDAVGCWNGQFHPDHPIFDLRYDDVQVVRFREKKGPVVEPDRFSGLANDLLREAHEQLGEFTEEGLHHPVCHLIQRIGWLLDGETGKLED